MRVLINTKPLVFRKSGIAYYISNILRALQEEGITMVPTVSGAPRNLASSLSALSCRMRGIFGKFYPSFAKTLGDILIRRLSVKESAGRPFDIYHETGLEPLPKVTARVVANLYDLSFVNFPETLPEGLASTALAGVTGNLGAADRIIVNTRFIRDEATNIFALPAEKIDVIPLAPAAAYHVTDRELSKTKVKRFTGKEYILYVGTVEPRKNLKVLIRAFRELSRDGDLALVIAGALGWRHDDIISFPEDLGIRDSVIFTGYIDEETMNHLYNCASVFVYPSLYEGFGLPPLEAMACGTPVVISDIPPLREVAGDAALTFTVSDHEALAAAMEKAISDSGLRSDMVARGLKRAQEFSWRKAARQTIETYEGALRR